MDWRLFSAMSFGHRAAGQRVLLGAGAFYDCRLLRKIVITGAALLSVTCGLTGRVPEFTPSSNKKGRLMASHFSSGRSGGIRTRGLLVPNQTRYQAALHLDDGANEGTRTPDLLITNQLLYRLSYIGKTSALHYSRRVSVCLGEN